ncbi:MAG: hypothetical protein IKG18_01430 [Atopobiaceae bacterium]|nr:hypothetical protein [Atopobiaceae bacterium]
MGGDIYELQNKIEDSGVLELDHDDDLGVSEKVKTNIPALDKRLGGGLKCGLHCLTAPPSSFKTALLLQVAYLAAMDGQCVNYITGEVSARECWQRLTTRKMQVDKLVGDGAYEVSGWASLEEAARAAARDGDAETLGRIGDAINEVKKASWKSPDYGKLARAQFRSNGTVVLGYNCHTEGYLQIKDMGDMNPPERWFSDDSIKSFEGNTRYLPSVIQHSDNGDRYLDFLEDECCCDLLVVDPINALRLFDYSEYGYRDHMPEPRTRMETIVETLDDFGRRRGIAIIGVFHGNRTRGQGMQHPSMGDFKETSAIEFRAVSAWELVRSDDMKWSGHPKPPKVPEGMEAVGLFLLKSRTGKRTEPNRPIWLAADGAHNLIMPL